MISQYLISLRVQGMRVSKVHEEVGVHNPLFKSGRKIGQILGLFPRTLEFISSAGSLFNIRLLSDYQYTIKNESVQLDS